MYTQFVTQIHALSMWFIQAHCDQLFAVINYSH